MKKKILLIDDSQDFLLLLSSLFRFHDIEVEAESNPDLALEKIQATKYLMVISDYLMGNTNGLDLSRKIRQTDMNREIKILLISYKTLDEDELKQVQELNLTYLRKPILPNELLSKIKELTAI
ncbi:MAG: response regulator [Bdellovibrio sp.]|nr:response regulator [Bdellovibrio sp.]